VTGDTGLGIFGIAVTAEAGGRIDPAVDAMATEIIPAVGHPPIGLRLIFDGGFELHAGGMAVVAEAGLMAETADLLILIGLLAVGIGKKCRVIELYIVQGLTAGVMALGAGRTLAGLQFFRMLVRQVKTAMENGAGGKKGQGRGHPEESGTGFFYHR
jgi:hypothetical protein